MWYTVTLDPVAVVEKATQRRCLLSELNRQLSVGCSCRAESSRNWSWTHKEILTLSSGWLLWIICWKSRQASSTNHQIWALDEAHILRMYVRCRKCIRRVAVWKITAHSCQSSFLISKSSEYRPSPTRWYEPSPFTIMFDVSNVHYIPPYHSDCTHDSR